MELGIIRQVSIVDEMRDAYLNYAMSVITARALPDVRDGLKPVQRRILYAMDELSLRHNQPHKKSARIVGEVLGKYHPHGDVAVYDAMVRLAQDFSLRYPLVDGHGNFGSVDGDAAAAMRYTEARLSAIAEEMLVDLDKDTVDFIDNFDGTLKEPKVLPARLPNLLVNGTAGIAVGMATNIPPHNLAEVCDAISYLIDHYADEESVSVEDLMRFIKGPDFPTGGSILGREGIVSAYATGKGRIVMRAKAHIEDMKGGRAAIIVTELPFQVNKANLIEKIADLVRSHRIETISDLRDESDRTGMRIVIELKRGAEAQTTLNQLLKWTQMQSTFGVNMLALVDGEPRVLSLKRALILFVEHRQEVITRRSRFELAQAKHRAHILQGLKIALDNLDEVIDTIRRSRDADTAMANLMRKFKLSEIQARAILDMQLRRLAALERRKIEEELAEVLQRIAYLEDLLKHPKKILLLIKQEMADLRQKYGDARRTRIAEEETAEFAAEDLIPSEDVLVAVTQRGYIKRLGTSTYRAQPRARAEAAAREEDPVLHLFAANSMDSALFFTDRGRVFQAKVHQVPDESRQGRGIPLSNLISLDGSEAVVGAIPARDLARPEFVVMVTAQGKIKRMQLGELSGARSSGVSAISLDEGDTLRWVGRSRGGQELILVTAQGKAIRFPEDEVRPMGRAAGGVNAIRLAEGDLVAGATLVRPASELVIVTANGYGKRTPVEEYPAQSRGGSGLLTTDAGRLKLMGPVVAACALAPDEELLLISAQGLVLRRAAKEIPGAGRVARGTALLTLRGGDSIAGLAPLVASDDLPPPVPEGGAAPPEPEPPEGPPAGGRGRSKTTGGEAGSAGKTAKKGTKQGGAAAKAAPKKAGTKATTANKKARSTAAKAPARTTSQGATSAPTNKSGEAETPAKATGTARGGSKPRAKTPTKPTPAKGGAEPAARKRGSGQGS
mgnify:FL=1